MEYTLFNRECEVDDNTFSVFDVEDFPAQPQQQNDFEFDLTLAQHEKGVLRKINSRDLFAEYPGKVSTRLYYV